MLHAATLPLLGRERERGVLNRVLAGARSGHGSVLALYGESGIGKTALLEDLRGRAEGMQVIASAGVESEGELPYAALHSLCSQMLEEPLKRLPDVQRDALRVAFGQSSGEPPDPFLVGLAVLNRLADVAEDQPVLCLVDDAQWLDRASALTMAFVARRLEAEAVAVVFAARRPIEQLTRLPQLSLSGLADDDARKLLELVLPLPLDRAIRERFIAETHGNPLALTELAPGLVGAHAAGGFAPPDTVDVADQVELRFRRQIDDLGRDARRLLVTAAAESVGDAALLWRACQQLGIPSTAAAAAEASGLLRLSPRVIFRHPLARSAAYRLSDPDERRLVHQALAAVTDPALDPDRRAWHRARSVVGPDEAVAVELERSAGTARARGGLTASAAFLERSVSLTADGAQRGRRALAAAQAKLAAEATAEADDLLVLAEVSSADEAELARAELLRAQVMFATGRGAPTSLINAAQRLAPVDPDSARVTYLEALAASLFTSRSRRGADVIAAARLARAAPPPSGQPDGSDLLLDGLVAFVLDGYATAVPILSDAVVAFENGTVSVHEGLRWFWLACQSAIVLWDLDGWRAIADRYRGLAQRQGALSLWPVALMTQAGVELHAGDLARAGATQQQAIAVSEAAGIPIPPYGASVLAAWRGNDAEARQLIETATSAAQARNEAMGLVVAHYATAVLCNGLGLYADALAAAERASQFGDEWWLGAPSELIEAAVRVGEPERATATQRHLSEMANVVRTPWALGIEARSRALPAADDDAEPLHRQAIDHLGASRNPDRVSSRAPPLRRVAPTAAAARRRTHPATDGSRDAEHDADRSVRRPRRPRAGGHRRASSQPDAASRRPADTPGETDRTTRRRRSLQQGNRGPALHQPSHRRLPPKQDLLQAQHLQPRAPQCRDEVGEQPKPARLRPAVAGHVPRKQESSVRPTQTVSSAVLADLTPGADETQQRDREARRDARPPGRPEARPRGVRSNSANPRSRIG